MINRKVLLTVVALGCFGVTSMGCSDNTVRLQGSAGSTADGSTQAGPMGGSSGTPRGAIETVFVILMENHSWSEIQTNSSAPYINGTLLPISSYAKNYKGPNNGGLHPSEPNYIWLEAGSNLGIQDDNDPNINAQSTTMHLVTLLSNAGISWKSYQEDITGTTCPLRSFMRYAPKHNPMVFFQDVTDNGNPNSQNCIKHNRPLPELQTDLTSNSVARYNFITPNLCNDMHGALGCQNPDTVKAGNDWLNLWIPRIMASKAYTQGGVIFITWDESEPGSSACPAGNCPIGMIVVSPLNKGGGYSNTVAYDHSSTLKTIEEIFGVTPLLGGAANATDLRDLFTTFP